MPEIAYIGLGSNIEPEKHIPRALALLEHHVGIRAVSMFYRTAAIAAEPQPEYLNGACQVSTNLEPLALKLNVLREIEQQLGRCRSSDRFAARCIDLDLLLYGDRVQRDDALALPDPDIRSRSFLAAALVSIDPSLRMPDTGERVDQIFPREALEALRPEPAFTNALRERLFG